VQLSPRQNQFQRSTRQVSLQYPQPFNVNRRLELALERMEVGRRVIIEEHPDQDSVESADRWHMRVSMTPNRAPRWW
jgi:hypothetical protein